MFTVDFLIFITLLYSTVVNFGLETCFMNNLVLTLREYENDICIDSLSGLGLWGHFELFSQKAHGRFNASHATCAPNGAKSAFNSIWLCPGQTQARYTGMC